MLVALSIRDIVLIDRLDLSFGAGLTVFTGETGAGKSIILDSLSLALGGRGSAGLVRQGAAMGTVTACFELDLDHPLFSALADHDLRDGETVLFRRTLFSDGRTKSFVNDRPISTTLLKALGRSLVEIHGQHDDRALLDAASHRDVLDQYGGLQSDVAQVGTLWRNWRDCKKKADTLASEIKAKERETEFLKTALEELDALDPQPDEEEALTAKRLSLQASEKVRETLTDAADALSVREFPTQKLATVLRRLERQPNQQNSVKPILTAIERVLIESEEARALLEAELRSERDDDIEQIEERLFKLRGLSRKHRVPVSELAAFRDRIAADIAGVENSSEILETLRKMAKAGAHAYVNAAEGLSANRTRVASALDRAVQRELKPLRLEKAKFITNVEALADTEDGVRGGAHGCETITFFVCPNPGAKTGPMMKVASGGELARFLLALKVVLADKNTAPVLVFDEIDTGVGGATAAAIGERLARLGNRAQVLAVTHSPQVAAYADAHYRLYKTTRTLGENITVETCAEALDEPSRREEIARMLAGREITQEARAAAERLIGSKHDATR